MTLPLLLLTYAAAALGFFLVVDGISYVIANTGGRGDSRIRRRLQATENTYDSEPDYDSIARLGEPTAKSSIGSYVERLIIRADLDMPVYRVYIAGVTFGLAIFMIMRFFMPFVPDVILAIAAIPSGFALPLIYIHGRISKRLARFQEQFPDALDLIVRSLRIGHPISAALTTIAEEISDPVGSEFGLAAQQIRYGKSTPEAIEDLANRVALQDLRFFAVAIQIHHETGGNLSEILSGLAKVIRGRFHLFRKVSALTVEGRFSAWFLSVFPVVMIFALSAIQPGYYERVSDLEYFPHLVVLTFVLLAVNVVAMRVITKLEV